ncbi:3-beta hydroxysteroid dehydrogenase [Prosthecochloris marina]|uniref:3-beta hydroxysteroid dehydrogenase n=1 Tax=Prosthecochloris marina TaxID=2017681 RepID=A0A317T9A6_9CHLB|nr:SDR family oxidoreductase [Prosthecochloris marina]PWW83155.1 3-beta hydroxysteroid dehydrogenase [Prosthecochloris marina]
MAMQKVLVVGASGHIGRYAALAFKKRGWFVRVLVRDPEKLKRPGPFGEPLLEGVVDEIVTGDAAKPDTLFGIADGIDTVFSSMGLRSSKPGMSYHDIDYLGNANILQEVMLHDVQKFIYVSIFKADEMMEMQIVKAHEDFVQALKDSGIDYSILRPNAYFSDMLQFQKMATSGVIIWPGDGSLRINPIHGEDMGDICVDTAAPGHQEIDIGGPDIFTYKEMFTLAFTTIDKEPRIIFIPLWIVKGLHSFIKPLNARIADMLAFAIAVNEIDNTAPRYGERHMKDFFETFGGKNRTD